MGDSVNEEILVGVIGMHENYAEAISDLDNRNCEVRRLEINASAREEKIAELKAELEAADEEKVITRQEITDLLLTIGKVLKLEVLTTDSTQEVDGVVIAMAEASSSIREHLKVTAIGRR